MTAKREPQQLAEKITGSVTSIGRDGRLVTDVEVDRVSGAPADEAVSIKFGGHETFGLYAAKHDQPESTMVASLGEGGFVEIEIVGMNLSEMLGIGEGAPIEITWGK